MVTRNSVKPQKGIIYVETEDGFIRKVKFVEGLKSYEGWYLPDTRTLMSQKELKVKRFSNDSVYPSYKSKWKDYIPKKILDVVFGSRYQLDPISFDTRLILAKAGDLLQVEELRNNEQ